MNKEKPYFFRRVLAYIIDMLIVTLLAGILSTILIKNEDYKNESQKLLELTSSYSNGEITKEEYTSEYENINYYLTKDSVGITVINLSVALVYYVILCFYCDGVTLGKRILKLKIISAKDKKLNLVNYLIRGLLINMILSNIISVTMVSLLSKDTFIAIYSKISSGLTLFVLATLVFMMYREDGRGIHDLAAGTKVISTKNKDKIESNDIQEAKVVKEKRNSKKGSDKK